jgi:superfamily II DNA or RNA helicase
VEHAKRLQSFFPDEPSALLAGSHKDRDKAKRVKLVFASYSMLEEGYDDPDLDTLILATPRSTIQQTIGRIEREAPGKAVPIVIDLVDNFSLFPNMYWKRQKFYTSRGFSIEIK